jgi:prepilin-type N-terminal cleavage/methylation domain-containing protein
MTRMKSNTLEVCNCSDAVDSKRRGQRAFTLIEMLVVIAVMALLATMIVGVGIRAAEARKIKRVEAESHKLITAIEAYQHKRGSYPPDNGLVVKDGPDREHSATNQLFYELTGPTYDANANLYTAFDTSVINSNDYYTAFNREGIANSIEPQVFYNPPPKAADYQTNFVPTAPNARVLTVPVDYQPVLINTWHYDSSSTNRHNSDSFDLWAVFTVGKKTVTNKNW